MRRRARARTSAVAVRTQRKQPYSRTPAGRTHGVENGAAEYPRTPGSDAGVTLIYVLSF